MADRDVSAIKPVQGLADVAAVTASKGHEERDQRQKRHPQPQSEHPLPEEESLRSIEDDIDKNAVTENPDEHIIDYCA